MKTNLLKLLASLVVVFSMSACNGPAKPSSESKQSSEPEASEPSEEKARVMNIAQALSISYDEETHALVADNEGVLATIENLRFAADIGQNRILCQFAVDDDGDGRIYLNSDLYGIEVELKEGTKLVRGDGETELGYTDEITVTGRITLERGKVVMKDASYTYVQEGTRRNWYIPLDRSGYNQYYSDAIHNGDCAETTFQVVELPTITAEGGTLKVVFPGEKADLEDNDFLLEIAIPAGLTEEQIAKYNEAFADVKVGGGLYMIFLLNYRGSMHGVLPYSFLGKTFSDGSVWMEAVELEGIFTNYEDALDYVDGYQDASLYEDFEVENAYSYVVDTSKATTDYSGQSFIYITEEYDKINRVIVNAYTDSPVEDAFGIYEALGDVGEDMEWVLMAAWDADGNSAQEVESIVEYLYFLMDKEEAPVETSEESLAGLFLGSEDSEEEEDFGNVYAQAYVDVSEGLVSLDFFGECTMPTYAMVDNSADAVAMIAALQEGRAAAKIENWETGLPEDVFEHEDLGFVVVDWSYIDEMKDYSMAETEVYVYLAEEATGEGFYEAIVAKLTEAGFVDANCGIFTSNPAGLWNEASGEFIIVSDYTSSYGLVYLDILTIYNTAFYDYIVPATAE